jgi:hypothetical protein
MGSVEASDTRIKLRSESLQKLKNHTEVIEFVIVHWTDRVYLIEPNRLIAFVNSVNSGRARQLGGSCGLFYLRTDGFEKPVSGLPEVPSDYQDYILKTPLLSTVLHFPQFSEGRECDFLVFFKVLVYLLLCRSP